jgi:hypothetical protein
LANISTNETKIITPAENHKAPDKNFLFVCVVKNTVAHHIAVLNHAKNVNIIAVCIYTSKILKHALYLYILDYIYPLCS